MSLYYLYTINYFIWVSIDTFAFCFLLFEKQLGKYPKKQLICFSDMFSINVFFSACYSNILCYSKKDKSVRYGELLAVVSEPLLQYIVDNVNKLVVENSMLLLIVAIITHAQGKLSI